MNLEQRTFWERLLASTDSPLRGFLRRRGASAWDVQDLAQEVYLRMLRVADDEARAISNPRAYLFTVASNLLKEHALMQRRCALGVDIDTLVPGLEAHQGSAEDEAERALRRRRLSAVLAKLPPRCRAVLVLQHRDGLSYAEIAERFGVSTHMVKKYVVTALTLCRNNLADED